MAFRDATRSRMLQRLQRLYPDRGVDVLEQLSALCDRFAELRQRPVRELWNQETCILITYGDQIQQTQQPALEVLRQFLVDHQLDAILDCVHLLPFFPYSSDDGFSVIDYLQVDPPLGDWENVRQLGQHVDLMFDLVINHCSSQSEWFQRFREGADVYRDFFLTADPSTDLSTVTRPRSSPLLTPVETPSGTRYVWTTFSADQVDLNFANPDVLICMLAILLTYVERGARVIRLDAIGFLWKKLGTSCMHLPETHEVVKLARDLLDEVAPGTVLLTETNVPHAENVAYFGEHDEAHMVYQFSLAPLLLDALLHHDAGPLKRWLDQLEPPGNGTTYFNFTASHDGIGVRPLEGLVPPQHVTRLVEAVRQRGGKVNMRRLPDGSEAPYELNITYVSALDSLEGLEPELLARRFLTSQGVMLALQGVPGIYFHSLVGTRNDLQGVERLGHNRAINRRKFQRDELEQILNEDETSKRIFAGYQKLLNIRRRQPAFHPQADQRILASSDQVLALQRHCPQAGQRILVLANFAAEPQTIDLAALGAENCEVLWGDPRDGSSYRVPACGIAWLSSR